MSQLGTPAAAARGRPAAARHARRRVADLDGAGDGGARLRPQRRWRTPRVRHGRRAARPERSPASSAPGRRQTWTCRLVPPRRRGGRRTGRGRRWRRTGCASPGRSLAAVAGRGPLRRRGRVRRRPGRARPVAGRSSTRARRWPPDAPQLWDTGQPGHRDARSATGSTTCWPARRWWSRPATARSWCCTRPWRRGRSWSAPTTTAGSRCGSATRASTCCATRWRRPSTSSPGSSGWSCRTPAGRSARRAARGRSTSSPWARRWRSRRPVRWVEDRARGAAVRTPRPRAGPARPAGRRPRRPAAGARPRRRRRHRRLPGAGGDGPADVVAHRLRPVRPRPRARPRPHGGDDHRADGGLPRVPADRRPPTSMERTMDTLARRLGLDPAELRRRNFLPPDAFPHTTPTGRALRQRGLPGGVRPDARAARATTASAPSRRERADRTGATGPRPAGARAGLLRGTFRGGARTAPSTARSRSSPDGAVTAWTGSTSTGQGHETVVPAGRGRGARRRPRPRPARGPRHPGGPRGPRNLRQPLHAGRRRRAVAGRPRPWSGWRANASRPAEGVDVGEVAYAGGRAAGRRSRRARWARSPRGPDRCGRRTCSPRRRPSPSAATARRSRSTRATGQRRGPAARGRGRLRRGREPDGRPGADVRLDRAWASGQALYEDAGYPADGVPRRRTLLDYLIPTAAEVPGAGPRGDRDPQPEPAVRRQGGGRGGLHRRAARRAQRGRRRPRARRRRRAPAAGDAGEGLGPGASGRDPHVSIAGTPSR